MHIEKYEKEGFAPMKFLDAELENYKDGYPNPITECYYETLKQIREIQNSGKVPSNELYAKVRKKIPTSEQGFYLANVHYYLYESCSEYQKSNEYKDAVNKRIIFFLEHADADGLFVHSWFPLNFPDNYIRFLKNQYGIKGDELDNQDFPLLLLQGYVKKYGNKDEKKIVRLAYNFIRDWCLGV